MEWQFLESTADITIQERLTRSKPKFSLLKDLHHAIGDDCGGTQVDDAFIEDMRKILRQKLAKLIKKKQPSAFWENLRQSKEKNIKIKIAFEFSNNKWTDKVIKRGKSG